MSAAPDLAEPVLGYRAFEVTADRSLRSLTTHGTIWKPGVVTAYCRKTRLTGSVSHVAPARNCTCGLYAYTRLGGALTGADWAIAAIAAWGELQVHDSGFRAQHACLLALAAPPHSDLLCREQISQAAERYGVVTAPIRKLTGEGMRHARPLPLGELVSVRDR